MNQLLQISMKADIGNVLTTFNTATTAGQKFAATLNAMQHGGKAAMDTYTSLANQLKKAGNLIAGLGFSMSGTFASTIPVAIKLEKQLNNVNSLLAQSGETRSLTSMRKDISAMANSGVQDLNTLADGLYNVTSAGFKGADAIMVLDQSQKAATAGMTNVATASTVLIGALRSYGYEATNVREVSDILFQGVNTGIFTFEQLAQNMGDILPIAAAAGVKLEDVAGALAAVTRAGQNPAEGSTAIARLIQQIVDPSDSLLRVLHDIGYESGAQALKVDGLYEVMMKLKDAGGKNIETLLQWFPEIRAARGALGLLSDNGKTYTDVMKDMSRATSGQGATQAALNEQMKSVSAQFEKFKNRVASLMASVGMALLPVVKIFLSLANVAVDVLNTFDSIPDPIKNIIAIGGLFGGLLIAIAAKRFFVNLLFRSMATGIRSIVPAAREADSAIGSLLAKMEKSRSLMKWIVPTVVKQGVQGIKYARRTEGNIIQRGAEKVIARAQTPAAARTPLFASTRQRVAGYVASHRPQRNETGAFLLPFGRRTTDPTTARRPFMDRFRTRTSRDLRESPSLRDQLSARTQSFKQRMARYVDRRPVYGPPEPNGRGLASGGYGSLRSDGYGYDEGDPRLRRGPKGTRAFRRPGSERFAGPGRYVRARWENIHRPTADGAVFSSAIDADRIEQERKVAADPRGIHWKEMPHTADLLNQQEDDRTRITSNMPQREKMRIYLQKHGRGLSGTGYGSLPLPTAATGGMANLKRLAAEARAALLGAASGAREVGSARVTGLTSGLEDVKRKAQSVGQAAKAAAAEVAAAAKAASSKVPTNPLKAAVAGGGGMLPPVTPTPRAGAGGVEPPLGPSTKMSGALGRLGNGMMAVGNAAGAMRTRAHDAFSGLITGIQSIGGVTGALYSLGMAWKSSGDAAKESVDKMMSGFKEGRVTSTNNTLKKINDAVAANEKKARGMTDNPGGFLKAFGKTSADLLGSAISFGAWDPVKDSAFDIARLREKLGPQQQKLLDQASNFRKNYASVIQETTFKGYKIDVNSWASLDLGSKKVKELARVAESMGLDLSKDFDKSEPARKKLIKHLGEMKVASKALGFGDDISHLTDAQFKAVQKYQKTIIKAGEDAGVAISKSMNIGNIYDPGRDKPIERLNEKLQPKGFDGKGKSAQIKDYYSGTMQNAITFVSDVNDLIARGLDPSQIQELLAQGPEAAGKAARALAESEGTAVIDIANSSTKSMEIIAARASAYGRITKIAMGSTVLLGEYKKAIEVQNAIDSQAGKATLSSVAPVVGLDKSALESLVTDFQIPLDDKIHFKFPATFKIESRVRSDASKWLKKFNKDVIQNEFDSLMKNTTLSVDEGQAYMEAKLRGDTKQVDNIRTLIGPEKAAQLLLFEAAWKGGPERTLADLVDKVNGAPAAAKQVLVEALLAGKDGHPLTPEKVKNLMSDYGLNQHQMDILLQTAQGAGVPGLEEALAWIKKQTDLAGEVHIRIHKPEDERDVVTKYLGLIGKGEYVAKLKMHVESGDMTGAQDLLDEWRKDGKLTDQEYTTTLRLIGEWNVARNMEKFLTNIGEEDRYNVIMGVINEPGSMQNLDDFVSRIGLVPPDVLTTLGLVGTDASIDALGRYAEQIGMTPEQVNTLLISKDVDPETRKRVADWFATHDGQTANMWVKANASGFEYVVGKVEEIRQMDGTTANVYVVAHDSSTHGKNPSKLTAKQRQANWDAAKAGLPVPYPESQGGILKFAAGGMHDAPHLAQIAPAGAMRLWAEPETGGEAYIPMGMGKRNRSTKILKTVARDFGYDMVPKGSLTFADGGYSSRPTPSLVGGGGAASEGVLHLGDTSIVVNGNADKSTVQEIERVLAERDRRMVREVRAKRGNGRF